MLEEAMLMFLVGVACGLMIPLAVVIVGAGTLGAATSIFND
ncbi:hypothetical protein [Methylobacterium sp. WL7]|nr:hypothetical protein [Methylobacterium sp. WL7]